MILKKGIRASLSFASRNRYASTKSPTFNYKDALCLDSQLTEEEILIRDTASAYCKESLMTRILNANRSEVFDREIFREMGKLGLLGSTINGYGQPLCNFHCLHFCVAIL